MYNQKLYKNGNSVAVTIPKDYLKQSHLRDGSEVVVSRDEQSGEIIIASKRSEHVKRAINPRFAEMLEKVNKQYAAALKELADK